VGVDSVEGEEEEGEQEYWELFTNKLEALQV
jgi:hypothetical protein